MLSFEQAGKILDQAVAELPEGIFDDLNGGVNLQREEKRGEDGRYLLGLYHHDAMGRWIEIFYGSFLRAFPTAEDDEFAAQLRKTLHHELTHHVENKAGDRTLEKWDEEQKELWEQGEPLHAGSILFVDGDGALSRRAQELFRDAAALCGLEVQSAGAALEAVTRETLAQYEAALCMTLEQAEALADRFPELEERVMCLGETDILPGKRGTERALRREIDYLIEELTTED